MQLIERTFICTGLNFLSVTSLAIAFKPKGIRVLNVSCSKCANNTFITEELASPVKQQKSSGFVIYTRILDFSPVTVHSVFSVMFTFLN
jgi:hypothetical protein